MPLNDDASIRDARFSCLMTFIGVVFPILVLR